MGRRLWPNLQELRASSTQLFQQERRRLTCPGLCPMGVQGVYSSPDSICFQVAAWQRWVRHPWKSSLGQVHLSAICGVQTLRQQKLQPFQCFNFFASVTMGPPEIKSSTYRLFNASLTLSGRRGLHSSRCCWMTPFSRNGDGAKPNTTRVKRRISTSLECTSLI